MVLNGGLPHPSFVVLYGMKTWHVPHVNTVEQLSTVVVTFDPKEGITDVRITQTGACMHLGGWGVRDSGPQEWRLRVGIKA